MLSYLDRIPVCVAYEIDGERTETFPAGIDALGRAMPIYEYLPGFGADISACRRMEDLPAAARDYVRFIENAVGCPIRFISVGAERDACIRLL